MSDDGRYVAFVSNPCAFGFPQPVPGANVWLRDRTNGTTTIVAGTNSPGAQPVFNASPAISGNGPYIAFDSSHNSIVPDTNLAQDVFVFDRQASTYERVSVSSTGEQANGSSSGPLSISDDGRRVAFYSSATNLVANDTNDKTDIFVHDRVTGQTYRASTDFFRAQSNDHSFNPRISANGKYVTFLSYATNLVGGA